MNPRIMTSFKIPTDNILHIDFFVLFYLIYVIICAYTVFPSLLLNKRIPTNLLTDCVCVLGYICLS